MRPSLILAWLSAIALTLAAAQNCAPGTFKRNGACKPCPPGTIQPEANKPKCDPCQAGTFRPLPGGHYYTQCLSCAAGFTSNAGATACRPCPKNTFSRAGWARCLSRCKPGHGFSRYGGAGCAPCPRATYNDGSFFECRRCPSGTAAVKPGTARCVPCAPGTFRDMRFVSRIDIASCLKCPLNTFSSRPGARQCTLCAPGMVAPPGSRWCKTCPAGTYRFGLRYHKCQKCPAGTRSLGKRPARCRHPKRGCPFGTFLAQGECRACRPGERLDVAKRICVRCQPGHVSRGGSATYCEKCGPGEEPEDDGSFFEGARCRCRGGWQRDASGACTRCPAGEISNHRPSGAIWNSNERTSGRTSAYCQKCSTQGEIAVDGGRRCAFCPVGTVPSKDGKRCTRCPGGTVPEPGELIGQEPDDEGENPHSNGCVRVADGCPIGESLARAGPNRGSCSPFKCPSNAVLAFGFCLQCQWYERYSPKEKRCVDCVGNTANPARHVRQQCTPCGPNGESSFGGGCKCKAGYAPKDGRCVSCPAGTVATTTRCAACQTGVWTPDGQGSGTCSKCPGALVLKRGAVPRCARCKPGFSRAYDMLGDAMDACKPRGDYFPVGFKGSRFG